jgi:hypothetical protein
MRSGADWMAYIKRILCLASSRRPPAGRCIAGLECDDDGLGAWVRPVSPRRSREVSEEERAYRDGSEPRVFDLIDVPLLSRAPSGHQTENHVLDPSRYWERVGRAPWERALAAVAPVDAPLWASGGSTVGGLNDRVPDEAAAVEGRSLMLVRPAHLTLEATEEAGAPGTVRRRVRAAFEWAEITYRITVTDPVAEERCLAEPGGILVLPDALVCVSLSEGYKGFAYKLAASVLTPGRAGGA